MKRKWKKDVFRRKGAKRALLGFLSAATALNLTGCFDPANNQMSSAYGPPLEDPTGAYDPAQNMNEDVYGPPEWFDGEEEPEESPEEDFDPAENYVEDVYGPPEWFDGEEEPDD